MTGTTARGTPHEQRIGLSLYRLLSEGQPVDVRRVRAEAEVGTGEARAILSRWSNVRWSDDHRVVAFGGLSLPETRHRLLLDGRTLYTWCAWDTLFLPILLRREARVESVTPHSGERVALTVRPEGVRDVRPETAVLSFVPPPSSEADLVASFCSHIHFFAAPEAARGWLEEHDDGFLLSIEEGFDLGRRWAVTWFRHRACEAADAD